MVAVNKARNIAGLLNTNEKIQPDSDSVNTSYSKGSATLGTMDVYSSIDSLPSSAAAGTKALVTSTNTLYIYNSGWYKIATINSFNPQWIIEPASNYTLDFTSIDSDLIITVQASDSDDVPITYTAVIDSDFNVGATITHDSDKDNSWVISRRDSELGAGTTGNVIFKASDGINLVQKQVSFIIPSNAPPLQEISTQFYPNLSVRGETTNNGLGTVWINDLTTEVTSNWNITGTTITGCIPFSIRVKPNGTAVYLLIRATVDGTNGFYLGKYTLSTQCDLTTASFDSYCGPFKHPSAGGNIALLYTVDFNSDYTEIFTAGSSNGIFKHTLSTGEDLSTFTQNATQQWDQDTNVDGGYSLTGLFFAGSGTKVYMSTTSSGNYIRMISLNTAYDLDSHTGSPLSFTHSDLSRTAHELWVDWQGQYMVSGDRTDNEFIRFRMASYHSNTNFGYSQIWAFGAYDTGVAFDFWPTGGSGTNSADGVMIHSDYASATIWYQSIGIVDQST